MRVHHTGSLRSLTAPTSAPRHKKCAIAQNAHAHSICQHRPTTWETAARNEKEKKKKKNRTKKR